LAFWLCSFSSWQLHGGLSSTRTQLVRDPCRGMSPLIPSTAVGLSIWILQAVTPQVWIWCATPPRGWLMMPSWEPPPHPMHTSSPMQNEVASHGRALPTPTMALAIMGRCTMSRATWRTQLVRKATWTTSSQSNSSRSLIAPVIPLTC